MDAVETLEHKGYAIEIFQDEDPENPIKNWDMLGKFCCWHRNYDLGNCTDFDTPEDVEDYAKKHNALLYPLYMYDHSGIALSLDNSSYPFNCRWDSMQLGYILVERKAALKEYGEENFDERVRKVVEGEVKTYNQYLCGDVYGFIIKKDDEETDSCWGFYGTDAAIEAAKENIT